MKRALYEWKKMGVIQKGNTGRTIWTDMEILYIIVKDDLGQHWFVDYPSCCKEHELEWGRMVKLETREVWVNEEGACVVATGESEQ